MALPMMPTPTTATRKEDRVEEDESFDAFMGEAPWAVRATSEPGRDAAVDVEDVAIHEARRFTGQEDHGAGQFMYLPPAAGLSR